MTFRRVTSNKKVSSYTYPARSVSKIDTQDGKIQYPSEQEIYDRRRDRPTFIWILINCICLNILNKEQPRLSLYQRITLIFSHIVLVYCNVCHSKLDNLKLNNHYEFITCWNTIIYRVLLYFYKYIKRTSHNFTDTFEDFVMVQI